MNMIGKTKDGGVATLTSDEIANLLRPDYEPERCWFHPASGTVFAGAGFADTGDWREVTPGYAAYLRDKPEGDCGLRKVKKGDEFYAHPGGVWLKTDSDMVDTGPGDRGYRWCRKPAVDIDALREVWRATLEALNEASRANTMAYQRYLAALQGGAK